MTCHRGITGLDGARGLEKLHPLRDARLLPTAEIACSVREDLRSSWRAPPAT
jgi:hypothetical protein